MHTEAVTLGAGMRESAFGPRPGLLPGGSLWPRHESTCARGLGNRLPTAWPSRFRPVRATLRASQAPEEPPSFRTKRACASEQNADDPSGTCRHVTTTRIVIFKDTVTHQNGNGYHPALSPRQAEELADREARRILEVSSEEAFKMLDRGDLEGTAAEAEFRMLRFLAASDS